MNERLRQLMVQADYPAPEIALRAQKFAELIVRECMNTINPKTGTKWIKDQTQEEFWKNQSVHLIKKHFGVEE